jgi:hypothetical protein
MFRRAGCSSLPVGRTLQARSSATSMLAKVRASKLSAIIVVFRIDHPPSRRHDAEGRISFRPEMYKSEQKKGFAIIWRKVKRWQPGRIGAHRVRATRGPMTGSGVIRRSRAKSPARKQLRLCRLEISARRTHRSLRYRRPNRPETIPHACRDETTQIICDMSATVRQRRDFQYGSSFRTVRAMIWLVVAGFD